MTDFGIYATTSTLVAPAPARPQYRYLVTDLRTGTRLGELPLAGVSYSEQLNRAAPLSATIDLAARGIDPISTTVPRRTALWVYRGNTIVWGGIIWERQARGRTLAIAAQSFWSYFSRRLLTVDAAAENDDQVTAARTVVQWALDQPGGDIGVTVGSQTSGVLITQQLGRRYELKPVAGIVEELAKASNGFDFAVTVYEENDVPKARFDCFYPRRGRSAALSGIVFRFRRGPGGNLIDYTVSEAGLDAAVAVYGVGAGDGADMILTQSVRTSAIDAGYPLQEATVDYRDNESAASVLALSDAAVSRMADTPMTWSLEIDPDDVSVPFGAWTVGDDARIVIEDDWRFPAGANGEPGFQGQVRVVGQTVTVPDDGGPEKVTLECAEPFGA